MPVSPTEMQFFCMVLLWPSNSRYIRFSRVFKHDHGSIMDKLECITRTRSKGPLAIQSAPIICLVLKHYVYNPITALLQGEIP